MRRPETKAAGSAGARNLNSKADTQNYAHMVHKTNTQVALQLLCANVSVTGEACMVPGTQQDEVLICLAFVMSSGSCHGLSSYRHAFHIMLWAQMLQIVEVPVSM